MLIIQWKNDFKVRFYRGKLRDHFPPTYSSYRQYIYNSMVHPNLKPYINILSFWTIFHTLGYNFGARLNSFSIWCLYYSCNWFEQCLVKYKDCGTSYGGDQRFSKTLCKLPNHYYYYHRLSQKSRNWITQTTKCIQVKEK